MKMHKMAKPFTGFGFSFGSSEVTETSLKDGAFSTFTFRLELKSNLITAELSCELNNQSKFLYS